MVSPTAQHQGICTLIWSEIFPLFYPPFNSPLLNLKLICFLFEFSHVLSSSPCRWALSYILQQQREISRQHHRPENEPPCSINQVHILLLFTRLPAIRQMEPWPEDLQEEEKLRRIRWKIMRKRRRALVYHQQCSRQLQVKKQMVCDAESRLKLNTRSGTVW